MNDWMIFAERITTEMERQQLSIKQLADKIGMTTTTVSRYAKGERVPKASEIVRTADALGVTCDYLVGLSDNPHRINEQMEMISKQAAIDAATYGNPQTAWQRIEQLPSAQKWIPCSERLPEEEKKTYWVCTDTEYQCECRWTNNRFGIGEGEWGWSIFDTPQYTKPIAWMPLPEPARLEETDG